MEKRLYIRLRGRIQGPFDPDRLRELVRRGQLSRIHQVSVDKVEWVSASTYSELFPPADRPANRAEKQIAPEEPLELEKSVPDAGDGQAIWHYVVDGNQQGPITLGKIKRLVQTGEIDADSLVWNESMSSWAPVSEVTQLSGFATGGVSGVKSSRGSGSAKLADVERTLQDSRSWVLGIAVCLYISGALLLILAAVVVVLGLKRNDPIMMAGGFNSAVGAGLLLWAAQLFTVINLRTGRFLQHKRMDQLDSVLRGIRSLWIFVCIVLILFFVNSLVFGVWLASIGVSLLPGG